MASSTSSSESSSSDEEISEDHVQIKGGFHGVYLLVSRNPRFKGRTYIGYTVNPERRIKQHNGGTKKGGARKTSGRGPWDMIMIIHGFPNDVAALRFEWAWQHPSRSRRIDTNVIKRVSRETGLQTKLRILSHMLSTGPWYRLPLTIRWLKQEYRQPFPPNKQPPIHMPEAYGLIEMTKEGEAHRIASIPSTQTSKAEKEGKRQCKLCGRENIETISDPCFTGCYHKGCFFIAHITCLAREFCPSNEVIPVTGECPSCKGELLWGGLMRRVGT